MKSVLFTVQAVHVIHQFLDHLNGCAVLLQCVSCLKVSVPAILPLVVVIEQEMLNTALKLLGGSGSKFIQLLLVKTYFSRVYTVYLTTKFVRITTKCCEQYLQEYHIMNCDTSNLTAHFVECPRVDFLSCGILGIQRNSHKTMR